MKSTFSNSAARLGGLSGVLLGWRPDDFWRATPAELTLIIAALVPDTATAPDRDLIATLQEQFPDG